MKHWRLRGRELGTGSQPASAGWGRLRRSRLWISRPPSWRRRMTSWQRWPPSWRSRCISCSRSCAGTSTMGVKYLRERWRQLNFSMIILSPNQSSLVLPPSVSNQPVLTPPQLKLRPFKDKVQNILDLSFHQTFAQYFYTETCDSSTLQSNNKKYFCNM